MIDVIREFMDFLARIIEGNPIAVGLLLAICACFLICLAVSCEFAGGQGG